MYMLCTVQSLWVGPKLSDMEIYSIKSFLKQGHKFILYTYENVKGIPKGTIIKDGNEIIKKKDLFQFKSSFLPFSDLFRYKMLYEKGGYWVDLDMICLKPLNFKNKYVFSSERTIQKGPYRNRTKTEIANIGILKSPKHSPFYKELFEECLNVINKKKIKENIQLMRIMRKYLDKYDYHKYVKPSIYFCPLDWWHTKDAFIPPCCRGKYGVEGYDIKSIFKKAYCVHMWRSILGKRHKLNPNNNYCIESLWENLKRYVDEEDFSLINIKKINHRKKISNKKKISNNKKRTKSKIFYK